MNSAQRIQRLLKNVQHNIKNADSHAAYSGAKRAQAELRRWRDYNAGGYGSTHREPESRTAVTDPLRDVPTDKENR